ncbi:hypothetical protein A3H89_00075 [Candidatus Amesbacteria bacterium RIFCSPLOWO2_02_FULL_48_11]|uniref:Small ribosomal subunit protein bS20 n=2 Tax=Candidatus Amesiibacteriota TaxID=1752730 RepID=A0A1F4ZC51_9BACT|nr:MAG: hypothetical protein A2V48_03305 [Candidatus Amesbacteria bacterium RBG_19FT_COMBO_48_16]OGC96879.1 MAG: hypothetical protein A3C34_02620 [Candidatus Amesbacteria bacterium RIFCSPHIGHO2_02_FULL_48_21]OGC98313.1 MAG: hypothetical protein A2W16_02450 [Candidatus Amesbacteria bacterium RBG_16_48_31]OGD00064.1 MAG: hypothetical protein A2702_01750 [Candidatus Amesbacteria bacterium RIFCSPHIGHO2_01_FULL_48_75]OGD03872.1 MAG: hypothetical protein A3E17_02430 [Candidatus Amesbacteria bacterium
MPITKGAIRKLRADKRKKEANLRVRVVLSETIRNMRKKSTAVNLKKVFKAIDKAAKRGIVHKNKAARIKSRLARLVVAKRS